MPRADDPSRNHRRLGFDLSPELADEALAAIAGVRAEPGDRKTRTVLIDCVLELTDAGLRAYYLEPLERAGLNGLGIATAKIGIATAKKGISTIANKLVLGMSESQVLSIADSMESFLQADEA